jgi:hypothetical protein
MIVVQNSYKVLLKRKITIQVHSFKIVPQYTMPLTGNHSLYMAVAIEFRIHLPFYNEVDRCVTGRVEW